MTTYLPRRAFLRRLAGVVAAGFAGGGMSATQALLSQTSGIRIDGALSYGTFVALVGQNFTLNVLDKKVKTRLRLQLVEVNSVRLSPNNDQFYLLFKLYDPKARPNGVYRIQHVTAGSTNLLLQSTDSLKLGNCCRADFNLLV